MKRKFWLLFVLLVLFAVPTVLAQAGEPPIAIGEISALTLGTIVSALLALALDYIPGLATKWDALEVATKQRWMAVFAVVIVGVLMGLTCVSIVSTNLVCTRAGIWDAISSIVYVWVIGQGTHLGAKPTKEFKREVLNIPA